MVVKEVLISFKLTLICFTPATHSSALADELGLVSYAAVMPHLLSTKGLVHEVPGINA
ncbi:exported hypothetical protein [Cupriavidus taiwanensis]|nr:exported hypothetical protein [Cupriavidus taiwanensis]SOZ77301.1 exported hypothetical protein [Cupriavidus taiwanensis]SOZ88724.1 exported hypothetical protein [Cupriavidus taiwanensis]SOZ93987.1 exported hypothetical protein [Cupriavidus taiwanensis]SPA19734.1 exported hypothetical protein [Cupriavidus taiwanensis]